MLNITKMPGWIIGVVMLALAFLLIPFLQLDGLDRIPGNLGDSRLNNYFLEHIYLFLFGNVESLWHPRFFYPFPFVLGFSDNLLGSSPVYVFVRLLGAAPDTSFQVWFLFSYLANFTAAYAALRMLGCGNIACSFGALIFAFALPVTGHAGHAQLSYRFGVPLALASFICFLSEKRPHLMLATIFWAVWQLYAGIYIGFFTLLLLAIIAAVHLYQVRANASNDRFKLELNEIATRWQALPASRKHAASIILLSLVAALILLFYPYLKSKILYHIARPWSEVSMMLPRWHSYFVADTSLIWSKLISPVLPELPRRNEHQMFPGLTVYALVLLAHWIAFQS